MGEPYTSPTFTSKYMDVRGPHGPPFPTLVPNGSADPKGRSPATRRDRYRDLLGYISLRAFWPSECPLPPEPLSGQKGRGDRGRGCSPRDPCDSVSGYRSQRPPTAVTGVHFTDAAPPPTPVLRLPAAVRASDAVQDRHGYFLHLYVNFYLLYSF